ncbi:hypothetical protein Shyhy02_17180 [Streptomyces hygroscopicus subsp. hygroscopicus]|nr:hypothetical protein Shyhy02_17180 [Streptomyces hygroscopicus subsp. hygroscopicus]
MCSGVVSTRHTRSIGARTYTSRSIRSATVTVTATTSALCAARCVCPPRSTVEGGAGRWARWAGPTGAARGMPPGGAACGMPPGGHGASSVTNVPGRQN